MTPQEHYEEAEEMIGQAFAASNDDAFRAFSTRAQVHATLALAGFTRDLDYDARRAFESSIPLDADGRPVF